MVRLVASNSIHHWEGLDAGNIQHLTGVFSIGSRAHHDEDNGHNARTAVAKGPVEIATPPSGTPCNGNFDNLAVQARVRLSSADRSIMSREHNNKRLPPGWIKCTSSTYNRSYFFNTQTNESLWFPPKDHEAVVEPPVSKRSRQQPPPLLPNRQKVGHVDGKSVEAGGGKDGGYAGKCSGLRVAIIVPYRDLDPAQRRAAHLASFVPYIVDYLGKHVRSEGGDFQVYIVEQSMNDGLKFNRGKLLNIGFDLARAEDCNAFVFHDVDLLPSDELGRWYASRPDQPVHIARVWKQYSNNPKYFGGVVSFNREDFEKINGFPNTFWGWGGEDDEMYSRIMEVNLVPQKAERGEFTDLEGLDLSTKLDLLRKNEHWKCQVKKEVLEEHAETWRQNGLADLKYSVLNRQELAEGTQKVTVDVQLNGHWTDTITHWRDLNKRHRHK